MDDLEDTVEKEKHARIEAEKQKRKIEGDLRLANETLDYVERSKKELETAVERKNKEISSLNEKLEKEQNLVSKGLKQIKECGVRIEELEEEVDAQRGYREKADRMCAESAKELEDLEAKLEESGGVNLAQIQLNRKREAEINKMKQEMEGLMIEREAIIANLRKKHGDVVNEMEDQIEAQNKIRARYFKQS